MHISVVIPVFNAAELIARALRSVAEQERRPDEVVIVDDGSSDETAAVIETWRNLLPISYVGNDRNCGIALSLTKGVEAATGDLVLRLDADDYWLSNHVAALEGLALQCREAVLFSSRARIVDTSGTCLGTSNCVSDCDVRAQLMWDNPLVHSATGFRRSAYLEVGGYREGLRWEDYDLWIRLLERGSLAFVERPTAVLTISPSSLSRIKRSAAVRARWKLQRTAITTFWRGHPAGALWGLSCGWVRAVLAGGA